MKKWKIEEWIGMFFLLAALVMLVISVRLCFADGIWYDELYTMGLTGRSFADLTALAARDVHPPFYYYYVKIIQMICKTAVPEANAVVISKIASVLPLAGLFAYAVTKVRKRFGLLCSGIFIFCLISMPNLPQYTVEIRMYTLSMFLVTAAFIHAYEIACGWDADGKAKGVDWIFLTVYGILAAYTHYFACVAAGLVFLYLLCLILYRIRYKKDNKFLLGNWLISVAAFSIAYFPWLFVAAAQVARVKENYWILPLTWRTFGSCVKFLMKPPFGNGIWQVMAAVILFFIYVGLMGYFLWNNRKNQEETFFAIAGTGVLAGVVLFGFAASFLLRPIFIVRYMLPAVGCFWLSFSVFVSKTIHRKRIFIPAACLILIIGIGDYRWFRNDETWRRERMEETEAALSEILPEDMVITHFNHVQGVTGYYLDNVVYLWDAQPEELICDIIENKYDSISSVKELKDRIEAGNCVWFIGSKQADVLREWEQAGIHSEEKQEFMLEVYWATLYRLYLE